MPQPQESFLEKHCVPCEGGMPPLDAAHVDHYLADVPGWTSPDRAHLVREFAFADFAAAMIFVNKIAAIAEAEGHHPDIHVFYNKVRLELNTHAVGGLSENDFILAAKIDAMA